VEREPDMLPVPDDDDDLDLFGDPDAVDGSVEDELDERLEEERHPD
jgi:hypothetical protein